MANPLAQYRRLFPVTRQYAYLNHAACSPMAQPGLDALARYWEAQSTMGVLCEPEYFPIIDVAREKMARLIGAEPREVGWVQNTSNAANMVAHGLPWREGDNVIAIRGEFPANIYPWLGLRRLGVEPRLVDKRGGRVCVEDVAAAIDGRTRLLSVSFVDFATGNRAPIAALGQLCRERGVLFNVDGIQGVGALAIDVHDAGIHFLGAGAHKALLGPQGVGLLYIRHDVLDRLWPLTANWKSVVDFDNYLNYEQPWVDAASRIEGSTSNVSGIVAFDAILNMILAATPAAIEARNLALTGRLIDGLLSRGYELASSTEPEDRSSVVCFKAKGDPLELLDRAIAANVIIAVRVGVVRVSPHFYNTEEEIDRLLDLL